MVNLNLLLKHFKEIFLNDKRNYHVHMIAAHFAVQTLEINFDVGDVVSAFLDEFQLSAYRYLLAVAKPIFSHRLSSILSTDSAII